MDICAQSPLTLNDGPHERFKRCAMDFHPSMNILSAEDRELTFYVQSVVTPIIAILGILGNIATFVIIQKSRRIAITILLQALSVYDLIYLTLIFVTGTLPVFYRVGLIDTLHDVLPYILIWANPIIFIAAHCSMWCVCLITIYRYVAIYKPFWASSLYSGNRSRLHIVILTVVAIMYNIPRMLEFQFDEIRNPKTNMTQVILKKSELKQNEIYQYVYSTGLTFLVTSVVPLLILVILNSLLIRGLHKANLRRQQLTGHYRVSHEKHSLKTVNENNNGSSEPSKEIMTISTGSLPEKSNSKPKLFTERRLTQILIVIITTTSVCIIFDIAGYILLFTRDSNYEIYRVFFNTLVACNMTYNFLLYSLSGKMFRKSYTSVLCRCHNNSDNSSTGGCGSNTNRL